MLEIAVAFAAGLVALVALAKLIALPFKLLWKFVTNSVVGGLMLWAVSLLGIPVKITILTALVAGVLGIPGVILVVLLSR